MNKESLKISNEINDLIAKKHLYSEEEYINRMMIIREKLQNRIINTVDNETHKNNIIENINNIIKS